MKIYEATTDPVEEMGFTEDPWNVYLIFDYAEDPPPGTFDYPDALATNPFAETILRKIGGTWYSIHTECDGTEPLEEKLKRLIFTDPLNENENEKEMSHG